MMSEAEERRQAEIDFVAAAYPDEAEAWVEQYSRSSGNSFATRIHRRLQLALNNDDGIGTCGNTTCTDVILSISMPEGYPVQDDAILEIEARISSYAAAASSSSSSNTNLRKLVLNALPSLVGACRSTAQEYAGGEALFSVLGRAEEWVSNDWVDIVQSGPDFADDSANNSNQNEEAHKETNGLVLGRRLIHSHHIIAPSKRKAIVELAQHYHLGGYAKIGWPGIIIVEGEEEDCISYVDEIRSMRWQHIVVRGEQHVPVKDRLELEETRALPGKMQEVGDKMSIIAEHCKRAGLEELFLTAMKIYKKDDDDKAANSSSDGATRGLDSSTTPASFWRYGALCHVDHMNDGKNYRKWLRKAAAVAGCTLMLKMCNVDAKRPLIIVAIVGEEDDVKRVLKRWRTSRVDVDSAGRPCLERMMTVLVEGNLGQQHCDDLGEDILSHMDCMEEEEKLEISEEYLSGTLCAIGGSMWSNEFKHLVNKR